MKFQGVQSYVALGNPDFTGNLPLVRCSDPKEAAKIRVFKIGKGLSLDANPVAILHCDNADGHTRILDFADTNTGCFTALQGSTYPKNQQFSILELKTNRFEPKMNLKNENYIIRENSGSAIFILKTLQPRGSRAR